MGQSSAKSPGRPRELETASDRNARGGFLRYEEENHSHSPQSNNPRLPSAPYVLDHDYYISRESMRSNPGSQGTSTGTTSSVERHYVGKPTGENDRSGKKYLVRTKSENNLKTGRAATDMEAFSRTVGRPRSVSRPRQSKTNSNQTKAEGTEQKPESVSSKPGTRDVSPSSDEEELETEPSSTRSRMTNRRNEIANGSQSDGELLQAGPGRSSRSLSKRVRRPVKTFSMGPKPPKTRKRGRPPLRSASRAGDETEGEKEIKRRPGRPRTRSVSRRRASQSSNLDGSQEHKEKPRRTPSKVRDPSSSSDDDISGARSGRRSRMSPPPVSSSRPRGRPRKVVDTSSTTPVDRAKFRQPVSAVSGRVIGRRPLLSMSPPRPKTKKRGRPFLMKSASKRFGNASDTETDGETVNKTVTRKRGRPRVKARSPSTSSDDDMTEANERSSQRKQGRPRSGSQPRPPAANSNQPNPENSSEKRKPDILRSKNRPRPMNGYPESSRKGQDQPERKLTCTRIRSPFSQRTGSNGNSPVKTQDRLDQVYSDKIGTKPSTHRKPCVRRVSSGSEDFSRNDRDYYGDVAGRERAERSRGKPSIGDVPREDKGISLWSARLKPDVMIEEFKQEVDEEDDIVEAHPGYRPVTSLSPDWMGRAREVWRARDAEKKHTSPTATFESVLPETNLSSAPVNFDPMYGVLQFGKPVIPCQHDFQLPRTVFGDLEHGSLAYGQSSHSSSGEDRRTAKPSTKPRPFEMQPHLDADWMRIKPRLPEAERGQAKPRPFVERDVENRPRPLEQETSQARPTPMDNEDANFDVDVPAAPGAAVNREGVGSVSGEYSANTDRAEKEQQSGPVPPQNEPAKRRGRGRPRKDEKNDDRENLGRNNKDEGREERSMTNDDTASEGIERDSQTDVEPMAKDDTASEGVSIERDSQTDGQSAIPDIIGSGLRKSERSTRFQGNVHKPADGSKNMKEKEPPQQSSSCSSSQQNSLETSSADEGPSAKRRGQTGRGRGRPAGTGERRTDRLFHQQLGSPPRPVVSSHVQLPLTLPDSKHIPPYNEADAALEYTALMRGIDEKRKAEMHFQIMKSFHRLTEVDPSLARESTPR